MPVVVMVSSAMCPSPCRISLATTGGEPIGFKEGE
jgi:hypothetical protein